MKNKGITLIALVITVIIMVILVSVTINLATNGGMVEKTRTATSDYQYEVEKEEFELAKANATDFVTGEVIVNELETALDGWSHEGKIWTSSNGNEFILEEETSEKKEEVPSFTFNDFKDCYTMGKNGIFSVPVSKFLEVCGLEDLKSNKYYVDARRRNSILG